MPQDFTQDERLIAVETPLGKDHFLLTGISGHEAVSQLFEFDLEMLGGDDTVDDKKLVGENVTFSIKPRGGERSFFNGFISNFHAAEPADGGGRRLHPRHVARRWCRTPRATSPHISQ